MVIHESKTTHAPFRHTKGIFLQIENSFGGEEVLMVVAGEGGHDKSLLYWWKGVGTTPMYSLPYPHDEKKGERLVSQHILVKKNIKWNRRKLTGLQTDLRT